MTALLGQLASMADAVVGCVKPLYDKCRFENGRTKPMLDELVRALDLVVGRFQKEFLVVDALDECQSPECWKSLASELSKL